MASWCKRRKFLHASKNYVTSYKMLISVFYYIFNLGKKYWCKIKTHFYFDIFPLSINIEHSGRDPGQNTELKGGIKDTAVTLYRHSFYDSHLQISPVYLSWNCISWPYKFGYYQPRGSVCQSGGKGKVTEPRSVRNNNSKNIIMQDLTRTSSLEWSRGGFVTFLEWIITAAKPLPWTHRSSIRLSGLKMFTKLKTIECWLRNIQGEMYELKAVNLQSFFGILPAGFSR